MPHRFGLARLPFLPPGPPAAADPPADGPLVFAAQAKVPVRREEREQILLALAQAGPAVVKLRALSTEWQTHHEPWPYPQLYAGLVQAGRVAPDALHFAAGSMTEALAGARGLVTVSSTAALEAMALGLPVLTLSDFGVSEEMINTVFAGSGCLGTLADLAAGRPATADPAWTAANYFHPPADNTWLDEISDRVAARGGRRPAGAASGQRLPLVASASSAPAGRAAGTVEPGAAVAGARVSSTRSHSSRTAPEPPGRLSTRRAARCTSG